MDGKQSKNDRLEETSKKIGTRHTRKLRKFSNGFNEKFLFFFNSYRKGILNFCGEDVQVEYDINSFCSKEGFRLYDDGYFKKIKITSRQPNILKSVIIGKKSWGLFLNEWALGISECNFTKDEIIEEFTKNGIIIPESFMLDFDNRILQYKIKRNNLYN